MLKIETHHIPTTRNWGDLQCLFINVFSTEQRLREIATFIGNADALKMKNNFKGKNVASMFPTLFPPMFQ
jgi:hypothetical protein